MPGSWFYIGTIVLIAKKIDWHFKSKIVESVKRPKWKKNLDIGKLLNVQSFVGSYHKSVIPADCNTIMTKLY
jgi:hypothetical protein